MDPIGLRLILKIDVIELRVSGTEKDHIALGNDSLSILFVQMQLSRADIEKLVVSTRFRSNRFKNWCLFKTEVSGSGNQYRLTGINNVLVHLAYIGRICIHKTTSLVRVLGWQTILQSILYIKLTEKSIGNTVLSIFCFVESIVSVKRTMYNTSKAYQNILNRLFLRARQLGRSNFENELLRKNVMKK